MSTSLRYLFLATFFTIVWTLGGPGSWHEFVDGSDLTQFVTRPDIQAPRYLVSKHRPDAIKPGYLFVSPWIEFFYSPKTREKNYAPCIVGPMIYDGDGELVWSGACEYGNRPVFDLRPIRHNGSDFLTFIVNTWRGEHGHGPGMQSFIMNNQYQQVNVYNATDAQQDPHEFHILPDHKTALLSTREVFDIRILKLGLRRVISSGFQEIELATNKVLFDWRPLQRGIFANESCDVVGMHSKDPKDEWDFFHINSVDKFANGDYLISARRMSQIYRLSRRHGRVIWRLGGCHQNSDFTMEDGLPFYWQHDARVRFENGTHVILSLHDNAGETQDGTEPREPNHMWGTAVAKFVMLDTTTMRATMVRRFDRPDGGQTPTMGSVETLDKDVDVRDSAVLVNWAWEGYISEYDHQDRLVMEARFLSDRLRMFKAFKYEWKGYPKEPPLLKVLPVGLSQGQTGSAFYASWNGATEVDSWNLYGGHDSPSLKLLANVKRRGFETSWFTAELINWARAEAVDVDGNVLQKTALSSINPAYGDGYTLHQDSHPRRTWSWPRMDWTVIYAFAIVGVGLTGKAMFNSYTGWRQNKKGYHKLAPSAYDHVSGL